MVSVAPFVITLSSESLIVVPTLLTANCSRNGTNPNDIVLRRNGAVFDGPRVTSITDANSVMFTISQVTTDDDGAVFQCTAGELGSNAVTISVDPGLLSIIVN